MVNEMDLVGEVRADAAPDSMEISPSWNRVFIAMRGPIPLTGNAPGVNNADGATPASVSCESSKVAGTECCKRSRPSATLSTVSNAPIRTA